MTYIPLNKIITNLTTNGGEYQLTTTGDEYVGSYWKNYKGEFFTGKTPNEKPSFQLIPISQQSINLLNHPLPITQNAILFNEIFEEYEGSYIITEDVPNYNLISSIDITKIYNIPQQSFPTPTEDDYKLGSFIRYFCIKVNEDNYLEIDSKTFTSLINQDKSWNWQLYTPFNIQWTLTGNISRVDITNKNTTLLMEQRLRRVGFQSFLRKNYLKYYQ